MIRDFHYLIHTESAGLSIEQVLKKKGYSKHNIIYLRNTGGIFLNGVPAITPQKVKEGDLLFLHLDEQEGSSILPVCLPFPIVYEDEDLLVLDKPSNMPIHPSQGNRENTLANAAAWYFKTKGQSYTFRAINRLDRDTTGLLILAKHQISASILSSQSSLHGIHREYLAIAAGKVDEQGSIEAPIARADTSTILRCIDWENGEYAYSTYRCILYREDLDCSLVSLHLKTGRTHQIRVHMQFIGHPLLGDFLYYPDYRFMKRQALHSHRLEFCHPITGQLMQFSSPLPSDMQWIFPPI